MTVKIICAWCKKDMGEKEGEVEGGITHTICPKCSKKEKEALQKTEKRVKASRK